MKNELINSNAIQEINNLITILKNSHSEEQALAQIDHLFSFARDPTIYDEIDKLKKLVERSSLGIEYKDQLHYIETFLYTKEQGFVSIQDIFKGQYLNQKITKGISFLCPVLDKRTGGIQPGTITVIAGGPGSMKTTTVVNICYNALKEGKNVAYLSLEESRSQLYSKLLSRVSVDVGKPLPVQDILEHKLEKNDESFLLNEVQLFLNELSGNIEIIGEEDLLNYDICEIESKLKEVDELTQSKCKTKNNEDNHGIDILVVDHIQLLKYASTDNELSVINRYVSFFRRQSLSFLNQRRPISCILLSQVNREGITYASNDSSKKNHYGKYLMQHIAEASEIERSASYIITVYTDPMTQVSKLLKMGTLKLRGAPLLLDVVNIFADGEYYQVGEVPVPEQQDYSMDDINNTDNSQENSIAENLLSELDL